MSYQFTLDIINHDNSKNKQIKLLSQLINESDNLSSILTIEDYRKYFYYLDIIKNDKFIMSLIVNNPWLDSLLLSQLYQKFSTMDNTELSAVFLSFYFDMLYYINSKKELSPSANKFLVSSGFIFFALRNVRFEEKESIIRSIYSMNDSGYILIETANNKSTIGVNQDDMVFNSVFKSYDYRVVIYENLLSFLTYYVSAQYPNRSLKLASLFREITIRQDKTYVPTYQVFDSILKLMYGFFDSFEKTNSVTEGDYGN